MFKLPVLIMLVFRASSVPLFELDAESFYTAIASDEDVLVAFTGASGNAVPDISTSTLESLASRLQPGSGVRVCTYDVRTLGLPSGLHIHNLPAVILFPSGREPISMHDDDHDHSEADVDSVEVEEEPFHTHECSAHSYHDHGVEHACSATNHHSPDLPRHEYDQNDGHDHHAHAQHDGHDHSNSRSVTTVPALLRFLRAHSTAPSLIPRPTLAEDFEGRDVLRAIENGISVVRSQLDALKAENKELRFQLRKCSQGRFDSH